MSREHFTEFDRESFHAMTYLKGLSLSQLVEELAAPHYRIASDRWVHITSDTIPAYQGMMQLTKDWDPVLTTAQGSGRNHQVWKGGLGDHLADLIRIARLRYPINIATFRGKAPPYTLQSAIKVILLHDAEKFVRYTPREHPLTALYWEKFDTFCAKQGHFSEKVAWEKFKWEIIEGWNIHYELHLTDAERNAVTYAHGEGDDYRSDKRVMNELAAFLHALDTTGAREGYDHGQQHLGFVEG